MIDSDEQRILLFAPFGKDAELASRVLEGASLACFICKDIPQLTRELEKGAGVVLAVEEALPVGASASLSEHLARQPAWSDLPILVLTKPGRESPWIAGAFERLGNLTLLERPVRSSTLISAVRAALRARLRQYEMRKTDQRKDEFLAMLAHELRNPLAPIRAAADLLKIVSSDSQRVARSAEVIARQVGHMTNLIDDLLDVARVTRGLIAFQQEALDVRQILTEAVEQTGPLVSTRRHCLTLHLPPEPTPVLGDRKRLVQVVANLLGNASKYTPEGGNISVHLKVDGDEVVLEISDNGIGMTSETVGSVFDLFSQAERTPDRSQGGLGLGLALVKNLVVAHRGAVYANSGGLGKGSEFIVRLPRLEMSASAVAENGLDDDRSADADQSLRIMVVDDNVDAANLLEMFLQATGHQVEVEYAAARAIERARETAPQVCVLDIGLPDMDGHELARRLRSIPETADALLIALTGYGQDRDREKSIAAGFDHHFVKPLDTEKLVRLLSQFGKPQPRQERVTRRRR